ERFVLDGRVVKVGVMGRFNTQLQATQPGQAQACSSQSSEAGGTASNNEEASEQPAAGV
ncbi:MAG: hypothetical protein IT258_16195, partial [Saprospiraceae bacterium]|nr:hypothetical protein [Saprospiraceae bacterium]